MDPHSHGLKLYWEGYQEVHNASKAPDSEEEETEKSQAVIWDRMTKQGVVCTPVTPVLGRLKQENREFVTRLACNASPFLK